MQINPKSILFQEVVIPSEQYTKMQQVGIDLSLAQAVIDLPHGSSINVQFNESITLPDDMYAEFRVRSSLSRRGVFVSSGVYDPGYKGSLGCTLYNMSGGPITISLGERVGQLLCFKADAASTYNGQFQGK